QSQLLLNSTSPSSVSQATALLNQALAIGESIDNPRVISFALGKLGNLDERSGHYGAALEKTQNARLAADQNLGAGDSLYLWEWQLGRIYKAQDKLNEAAQAYGQAVASLDRIRNDILSANRDLQFDFRDRVEPIYRQYAELNLKAVPDDVTIKQGEQAFKELDTALVTLDSLKVAELQSYFANDCVIVANDTRVDEVGDSTATAVFSTAILADQLTVIVSLPDGGKKIAQVPIQKQALDAQINEFRKSLEFGSRDYRFDVQPAQQVYQWLIRPFEADLTAVKTLVFVNDGLLRSVPMSALHDGSQFLIEKFAVATTPSLTLTHPKKVEKKALSALLMGVSEPSELPETTFIALPAVEDELTAVAEQLPNNKILLNQDFSIDVLRQSLVETDYRVLHMATHGTFGFEPNDNFVVAGAKQTGTASQFNEKLTIGGLDELIRNVNDPTRAPIELLTLTACETAIGDTRSTLGLAGVALRAGVRSAIATLWSVGDASSAELISRFYENLQNPTLTKAEALQQAQISLLRSNDGSGNDNPFRWAPFVLIGNWL
ncbi:MAG: CHAT domain-containing protein, partial [Cyanobacteria bacterium P01_G01_bin.38]